MSGDLIERLFSLKGETALITGGYKGIGLMFSETYAEAGADVAIVARTLDKCEQAARDIEKKFGVRAIGLSMDVHDTESVDRVVQQVIDEFGKIDILVNCAGISGSEKPCLLYTSDAADE